MSGHPTVEQFEVGDLNVSIISDDGCLVENPVEINGGMKLVQWHRDYGSNHDYESPDELKEYAEEKGAYLVPVYLYDHSGVAYSTSPFSCPWDSGQVGYLLMEPKIVQETKDHIGRETLCESVRERLDSIAAGTVEEYSMWANGEVYGYTIERDGEEIDSCWGFIGMENCHKYAEEEAKGFLSSQAVEGGDEHAA